MNSCSERTWPGDTGLFKKVDSSTHSGNLQWCNPMKIVGRPIQYENIRLPNLHERAQRVAVILRVLYCRKLMKRCAPLLQLRGCMPSLPPSLGRLSLISTQSARAIELSCRCRISSTVRRFRQVELSLVSVAMNRNELNFSVKGSVDKEMIFDLRQLGWLMALGLLHGIIANATDISSATAEVKSLDGEVMGVVELLEYPNGVIIRSNLSGLTAGKHGFHIHEKGSCDDSFKGAGGHFNPAGESHGIGHGSGMHAGDLPNLPVPDSGTVSVEIFNPLITLSAGDTSIFDNDGSSIIIHARPDSYQKEARAGGRVGCGVISPG